MSHSGIEPEKNDGEGNRVAMDLDQLKQYFDAQLHDVKAQLSQLDKNISQKFNGLTAYSEKILWIVNNLDKGLAITGSSETNKGGVSEGSSSNSEVEEETVSDTATDEKFTILSYEESEDETAEASKQEVATSDQLQRASEKTGTAAESAVEQVITDKAEKFGNVEMSDKGEKKTDEQQQAALSESCSTDCTTDNMQQNDAPKVNPRLEKDSALPKTQPFALAAQKPALDDKALKQSARSAIDEYLTREDIKKNRLLRMSKIFTCGPSLEIDDFYSLTIHPVPSVRVVESTLDANFSTKDGMIKFVDFFIEYFVEKPIDQQKTMAPILVNLLNSKYNDLTPQIIANRLFSFPLRMNIKPGEIINSTVATELWGHMAYLMGFMLTSELFNFDHVWHSCKSILYTQGGDLVLSFIFTVIHSLKGRLWSVNKWSRSKVELEDFTMSADFVGKNRLGYLRKKEEAEEEASAKDQPISILRTDPHDALCPVQDLVKPKQRKNNSFYKEFDVKGKSVPFMLQLPNNFLPGSKLVLKGMPSKDDPTRFAIDFECGISGDIALHLNPRLDDRLFVRNSRQNSVWGTEDRDGPYLFAPGAKFKLEVECQDEGFKMILNGRQSTYYKHRLSPEDITDLRISGDVIISEVTYATPSCLGYLRKKEEAAEEEASAKDQLISILRTHPRDAFCPIQDWIKESWGLNPHSPILVRPLMKAICDVIGAGDGKYYEYGCEYTRQFDPALLNNHAKLLRFIINKDTTLEYICLKEVCISLQYRREQIRVLALNIFSHLLKLDIISVKGFEEFHSREPSSYPQVMKMNFFWECVLHSQDVKALFT